jgi:hypothetical protein
LPTLDDALSLGCLSIVMPALVAGIHVLTVVQKEGVDGRDKPGHDELGLYARPRRMKRTASLPSCPAMTVNSVNRTDFALAFVASAPREAFVA